jgi:phosphoribosylamine---glycine ligase
MIDTNGHSKVLEFNCRFGDPETQPVMMRLKSDLVALCIAACDGQLAGNTTEWDTRAAVGVVMAAGGYPADYKKGDIITGIPASEENQRVFQAGTRLDEKGQVLTNGGRVLCATALGHTVTEAQELAYQQVNQIHWNNVYFRKDIGYRAIEREQMQH